jgi:molybdopterin converting factor small subunit
MTSSEPVRVLLFGRLGEKIGREIQLGASVRGRTLGEVKQLLALSHRHAADDLASPGLRGCIDDVMADDASVIGGGTEVAFFPPLSGG